MQSSTTLLTKVDPSAQHHVPASFKWNHNIRSAKNVNRTPVELAPFNHQTFTPGTNRNIISFRLPMDRYADLTDAVVEFQLEAVPVGWFVHKNTKTFIRQLVVEIGTERIIFENMWNRYNVLNDFLSAKFEPDCNLQVAGGHDGAKLMLPSELREITADLLTGTFEIPLHHALFAEHDIPLPFLSANAIKIDLYLEDADIVLFDGATIPVGGTPSYTMKNVLLRYDNVTPPMEIQEQHKAALASSVGLITHHHSFETFTQNVAAGETRVTANITTTKGSISYILIVPRTSASLATSTVADKLLAVGLTKANGFKSLRAKLNGRLHPIIPLDTPTKLYWESAAIFGMNDKLSGKNALNSYWDRYPGDSFTAQTWRNATGNFSAGYAAKFWDNAAVYAIRLSDDKTGAISGWDNSSGRGQLQLEIDLLVAPVVAYTYDIYVVFDSFVKLTSTKSDQIY
jgi:hypothetical protein